MELKDVENLAELAKLDISDAEKQSLLKDFDSILAYVDMIKEADVGDVVGESSVYNVWREDLPRQAGEERKEIDFSSELITSQFPESQDNFVKVKKIL